MFPFVARFMYDTKYVQHEICAFAARSFLFAVAAAALSLRFVLRLTLIKIHSKPINKYSNTKTPQTGEKEKHKKSNATLKSRDTQN